MVLIIFKYNHYTKYNILLIVNTIVIIIRYLFTFEISSEKYLKRSEYH